MCEFCPATPTPLPCGVCGYVHPQQHDTAVKAGVRFNVASDYAMSDRPPPAPFATLRPVPVA